MCCLHFQGICLVYDIVNPESFKNLKRKWIRQIKDVSKIYVLLQLQHQLLGPRKLPGRYEVVLLALVITKALLIHNRSSCGGMCCKSWTVGYAGKFQLFDEGAAYIMNSGQLLHR